MITNNNEFGRLNPTEEARFTARDQAVKNIEHHVNDATQESPRFQAFADFVDHLNARNRYESPPYKPEDRLRLHLIEETVRLRKNGIGNYKREWDRTARLVDSLGRALINEAKAIFSPNLVYPIKTELPNVLINIKERAIDEKSLQVGKWRPVFGTF
jgi:hypothetical protein